MMESIRDPEKRLEVTPEQLQRVLSYQIWFNDHFRENNQKERKQLEKKEQQDFAKAIKELEELNIVYDAKKKAVENIEEAKKTREELALLEDLVAKLGKMNNQKKSLIIILRPAS